MARPPYTDFPQLFASTIQDLVGAMFACVIACMMGGAIPTLVLAASPDALPVCIFAWILYFIVAGIAIWGFIFVLIQIWCLNELVQGTGYPMRTLMISFVAQMTLSCIVIVTLKKEYWLRMMITWMLFGIPAVVFVLRSYLKQIEERTA